MRDHRHNDYDINNGLSCSTANEAYDDWTSAMMRDFYNDNTEQTHKEAN